MHPYIPCTYWNTFIMFFLYFELLYTLIPNSIFLVYIFLFFSNTLIFRKVIFLVILISIEISNYFSIMYIKINHFLSCFLFIKKSHNFLSLVNEFDLYAKQGLKLPNVFVWVEFLVMNLTWKKGFLGYFKEITLIWNEQE